MIRMGKIKNEIKQASSCTAGFSLIELAIIMVIIGLMVATSLQVFNEYQKRTALNSTLEKKQNIEVALGKFLSENGRLPCPAIPNLPSDDPTSGIENCPAIGAWPGTLTPTATCNATGFCRVEGSRRSLTSADNGVGPTPLIERDRILRGIIPYKSLGLALWEAYDGWGMMMTYAVTELLSNSNIVSNVNPPPAGRVSFKLDYGVLNYNSWSDTTGTYADIQNPKVTDGLGNGTIKSFPFAVMSHGPDRRGAWSAQGQLALPCAVIGAGVVPDNPRDAVNCNPFSNTFRDAARLVLVQGSADWYDDAFMSSTYVAASDKWYYTGISSVRSNQTLVGIGTEAPEQALEVNGMIRAVNVGASLYCDVDGGDCFDAEMIGGVGISCGSSVVMSGISNRTEVCSGAVDSTPWNCPAGSFLVGFCADSSPKCRAPGFAGYTTPACP